LKLKSAPPGATIKIDGQAIGVAPLDWDLTPGKHTIEMDKSGLKPAARDVVVTSNKSDLVVMTLTVDGTEPRDEGSPFTLPRWVSLTAVIGGGAAIAAGGVLIAVDQDPSPSLPPTIHNTAPGGVALVISGAVVGGLGAYFLWFRSPATASTPIAAFTGDSAYIGWGGRF
jgi:hypothetical protein